MEAKLQRRETGYGGPATRSHEAAAKLAQAKLQEM
jgi:hypothetical protein